MKSAVFGGTFDPVHNGHIGMAKELLKAKIVDSIIFLPAATPPHKLNQLISTAESRVAMLESVIEDGMEICLWEIMRRDVKTSYSYETMRELKKLYPNRELLFLMGMDSLNGLAKWKNFVSFIAENEFIVYVRLGEKVPLESELAEKLGGETFLAKKMLNSIHHLPYYDVSSTLVRARIASKERINDLVPLAVEEVIERLKLYR
ncbi:MAG: nicotinate (nicotinamide) nucleotide adenylyltransferase [Lentisphaeria bacterium]